MRPKREKQPFARQFRRLLLLILSSIILITGAVGIYLEYRKASEEIDRYEKRTFTEKKRMLENQVYKAISRMEDDQSSIYKEMRRKLKKRVYEAHDQARHLYNKYHGNIPDSQLKNMIIESLRPMRFFNNRGYYFIVNLEGTELLYPVRPEMEGKNVLNMKDEKENPVIKNEIQTVREDGEGFVEAYWPAPEMPDTSSYKKTSFVKLFDPYNWYIGCGDYKINMVQDAKEKALERLSEIKYGEGGNIFVNTYDGRALLIHSKKYDRGDDISDMTDPDGVKIFQKELENARKEGGGFIQYKWYEPKEYEYVRKFTYVNGYDKWQWIIGAWTDMEKLQQDIAKQKKQIRQEAIKRVIFLLGIVTFVYLFILIIANRFGKKISDNFRQFVNQLEKALKKNTFIDSHTFEFDEFENLTQATNKIIHDRNKAADKLEQSEAELKTIFQHAPIMIAGVTKDGTFEIYNDHVEKTLGYTGEELKNFEYAVKVLMKNEEEAQKAIANFRKRPGKFSEYRLITKGGSERIQYWASFSLFEDKTIIFGYDLTELKEAQAKLQQNEEELKKLNATKDKFFSIIAHDLKNPLNALSGFADLLKEEYDNYDEEERKEMIKNIITSTDNMAKLLQNLLEWSRSQMGRLSFNPVAFQPGEIIKENIELMKSQAAHKQIQLNYEKTAEPQPVYADKKMISTVLRNIISNAIKFSYPNGKITIRAEQEDNNCRVDIEDNGIGMTEEEKDKIFDVGEKFKKTGTSDEKGTGLGLILVKEFVEKNNGTIHVESTPNQGTTFSFTLPLSENE
ncbi:MAG: cache domain-containing protein [Bacteroidales bacterium]|nr:cache domain-containing protein [Bacteroidales bacterium]MCF8332884.1 cache domain-containing protein [Bacteroidales bacterium]